MSRLLAAALLTLVALPALAAAPVVRTDPQRRAPGRPSERALIVDQSALASLRQSREAVLDAFPLGADGIVTLELRRVEPFGPDTRVEEVTPSGTRRLALPDETYFTGTVRGDAASRVLFIAGAGGVRGFVVHDGMTYPFGRDALGTERIYAMRDVDPLTHPGPSEFCANDLHPDAAGLTAPLSQSLGALAAVPAATSTMLEAQVAVETDTELRGKFASSASTLSYLASLLAAANVVYERDVKVRLKFTYIRLWSGSDPWTTGDTYGALLEVRNYWLNPANNMDQIAGTRDMVHFVSGKSVTGGIAFLSSVCDEDAYYGVSQVFGSFDVSDPDGIWDVLVVTHELGHNVGSPHTHCYSPPVDHCYNGEPGCYGGPESVPAGGGTIMSYCHLLAPGLPNVSLVFGPTVSDQIRATVEAASCLDVATSCGDGHVDAGEQCDDGNTLGGDGCSSQCEVEGACGDGQVGAGESCDDGNTTGGDGCSATCQLETVCGNGVVEGVEQCDDGNKKSGDGCSSKCLYETTCGDGTKEGSEQCDDGNTVGGDGCSPTCHFEVCGNHLVDVGEQCDDGNVLSGDGCSPACVHEVLCGDGLVEGDEECDDHNTKDDDGCSKTCRLEPCQVYIKHQVTWFPAKLVAAGSRFVLRARFAVASGTLALGDVAAQGLRLMIDGASGARPVDVTIPGGAGWSTKGSRTRYRGQSGGVRSVVLRSRDQGIVNVDLKIESKGGAIPSPDDMPPVATVLLGGPDAGAKGACGHYVFGGGACTKRGKRLVCR